MSAQIEMFNATRNAIFARFPQDPRGGNHDQTLIGLKDQTFDAISGLSDSIQDQDLNQLLMQMAYRIHTFVVTGNTWRQDLLDAIASAFTGAGQVLAYHEMSGSPDDALDIALAA